MKNKTLAAWLSFVAGPFGLHRFYLFGLTDVKGWLMPIPTALGLYGMERAREYGVDDTLSWLLIPLLGFMVTACALNAIVYGLMSPERWNAAMNPQSPTESSAGATNWLTIGAIACALLIGATALLSSIAFSFQRYFEYQVEEGRKISQ